jgi:predicted DNA-binding transcriptional regulator YafY
VGVTSRIFQLHQLLKKERRLSLQGMMERLEVSRATIKRDLELLRDQLGAPLIYDRHPFRFCFYGLYNNQIKTIW